MSYNIDMVFDQLPPVPLRERQAVEATAGAISLEECDLLYGLAAQIATGCIVEVGSYRGRSTVALALGSMAGARLPVYAVEPHERFTGVLGGQFEPGDRTEFFKNMVRAGVAEIVRLVNLSSEVVTPGWSEPVGMLWIDGDHRYPAVKRDFDCWAPFLVPRAFVAFHDSVDPALGPSQVIAQAISSGCFDQVFQLELTTVLRRH
jgi:predicted O-methyltransferase YrrM